MSIYSELYTALTGNATLAALVSTRIYATIAPSDVVAPFVVYQHIASAPASTHGEAHEIAEEMMQFSCYADTFSEAVSVRTALINALDSVPLPTFGNPTLQDSRTGYEEAVDLHRADADFII